MTKGNDLSKILKSTSGRWLVTGAAGFIGSNLVESLLAHDQTVVGLDNFCTGKKQNIDAFVDNKRFTFIEGDIRDSEQCQRACAGVDFILHQAALGSVPRSIEDPIGSHSANVTGTVNIFNAAKLASVRRVVYASSSSVYGDLQESPKVEARTGKLLSPYAATKMVDEVYASVFSTCYQQEIIGLRYFNVFGPRQDPNGEYAAVIPRWVSTLLGGSECIVYGDGETSRDFCYIDNVVQANILAALSPVSPVPGAVYNIACGASASLNTLYANIQATLSKLCGRKLPERPRYEPFRAGDIKHSLADISRARKELEYQVLVPFELGIQQTVAWFYAGTSS